MSLTKDQLNYLHDIGVIPDRYYYQQNSSDPYQNYQEIKKKRYGQVKEKMLDQYYGVDDYYTINIKAEVYNND